MFFRSSIEQYTTLLVHIVIHRPQIRQELGRHNRQKVCTPHALQLDQTTGLGMLLEVADHLFAVRKEIVVHLTEMCSVFLYL